MKSARLVFGLVCGAAGRALFSGCETQQSACEREKRLTERMDEMQMDLDSKLVGFNAEVASLRANPPVVVQTVPTEMPTYAQPTTSYDSIAIEDTYPSKREQLEELARASREQVVYSPPATASASSRRGNIRVPVPARTVQAALREAGFYNGNIDGKIGRQSIDAITRFQRSQGITADGVVGRVTWQHLQAFVPAGMSTTRLK
ncbi:MAG: peptidoglycan-binding protein [Planctomycetes bacterium]|nr:peptidoglycan-binding protein [Planctomycetota bacterium]